MGVGYGLWLGRKDWFRNSYRMREWMRFRMWYRMRGWMWHWIRFVHIDWFLIGVILCMVTAVMMRLNTPSGVLKVFVVIWMILISSMLWVRVWKTFTST